MKDVNFLLVDDSPIVKKIVKKILEAVIGARAVHAANDSREAIKILKSEEVDFIICNWENDDMTENELLFEVRRNENWKSIPFVIMTSHRSEEFVTSAMKHGVTQCLTKPVTVHDLENSVRKYWNAASKRGVVRYSMVPSHRFLVKPLTSQFEAKVVNISRTGCLLRLEYNDDLRLFGKYEFQIEFEDRDGKNVAGLVGTVLRLENETADLSPANRTCLAAVGFDAETMDKKTEKDLNGLMRWLESLTPETIIK